MKNIFFKVFLLFISVLYCNGIDANNYSDKFNYSDNLQAIDQGDSIIFDLSSSVISNDVLTFPVYYISDEPIFAIDFSFNFNNDFFDYVSVSNPLNVDQVLAFVNPVDLKLRLTSNDLQGIAQAPLVFELVFNTQLADVCSINLSNISAFLNGEPCSYRVNACINPLADAGPDQFICGTTTTLQGNTPVSGTGLWTVVSGTGVISDENNPSSSVSNLGAGQNVFQWSLPSVNGGQASSAQVSIQVDVPPDAASVAEDFNTCETLVPLNALEPSVGTGIWSVIEGSGVISEPTNFSTFVSNLSPGLNSFLWSVSNGSCPPSEAVLQIFKNPSANAGSDTILCTDSYVLNAQGIGFWTIIEGVANIDDVNDPFTSVSNFQTDTLILSWSLTSGACSGSSDTLTIILKCNTPPVIISENYTIDEDNNLTGNILANGDFDPDGTVLSVNTNPISGPLFGTILLNSDGSFDYSPNLNFNGSDTVFIQVCDSGTPLPAQCATDTLIIDILPVNDAPLVENEFISLLAGNPIDGNILLNDSDPDGTSLVVADLITSPANGSIFYDQEGNITYTPEIGFVGNDFAVFQVCDNGIPLPALCALDTVFFEVSEFPFVVFAGNDTVICENAIVLNASNVPAGATGLWSVNTGFAEFENDTLPDSQVFSLSAGQNELVWTITFNGIQRSDTILITSILPEPAFAGGDQTICGNSAVLEANIPQIGIGSWSESSGLLQFDDVTNPGTQVNNILPGSYSLVWSIQIDICLSSDTLTIVSSQPVNVQAGSDSIICPIITEVQLNILVSGTNVWNWTTLAGSGSVNNSTSLQPTLINLNPGNNSFLLSAQSGACSDIDTLNVFVLDADEAECLQSVIFIPDGFSPNGDGTHDLFVIENLNGQQVDLQVFNRYGDLVYEAVDYQNDWNGVANRGTVLYGDELPSGTYYYIMKLELESDFRKNFITLWR